jgi:hypothetical protein
LFISLDPSFVMPGLVPGIRDKFAGVSALRVDGRVKPGHDEKS